MKFKRIIAAVVCISLAVTALSGCSLFGNNKPLTKEQIIKKLYKSQIDYVGDTSGVTKIIDLLGSDKCGTAIGIQLETDKEPYGVIRKFKGEPKDTDELGRQAAIMLCLIGNAQFINYEFGDSLYGYNQEIIETNYGLKLDDQLESRETFEKFYNIVYAKSEKKKNDSSLETLVSQATLDRNDGLYKEGECQAEGHIILGSEKKDGKTLVYALITSGEYGFDNGNFVKVSGSGCVPTRLTFDDENHLLEYLVAEDGSEYEPSIKKMFPQKYWERALTPKNGDYDECKKQEYKYAQEYLEKIGRKADIGEWSDFDHKTPEMSTEASNKLLDMFGEYPYWIGTQEKIENGTRYVYEKTWKDEGGGNGIIIFKKYIYGSGETVEKTDIVIKDGKISDVKLEADKAVE